MSSHSWKVSFLERKLHAGLLITNVTWQKSGVFHGFQSEVPNCPCFFLTAYLTEADVLLPTEELLRCRSSETVPCFQLGYGAVKESAENSPGKNSTAALSWGQSSQLSPTWVSKSEILFQLIMPRGNSLCLIREKKSPLLTWALAFKGYLVPMGRCPVPSIDSWWLRRNNPSPQKCMEIKNEKFK